MLRINWLSWYITIPLGCDTPILEAIVFTLGRKNRIVLFANYINDMLVQFEHSTQEDVYKLSKEVLIGKSMECLCFRFRFHWEGEITLASDIYYHFSLDSRWNEKRKGIFDRWFEENLFKYQQLDFLNKIAPLFFSYGWRLDGNSNGNIKFSDILWSKGERRWMFTTSWIIVRISSYKRIWAGNRYYNGKSDFECALKLHSNVGLAKHERTCIEKIEEFLISLENE